MTTKHSPHDKLFRETLSRRSEAILFFKHFLPKEISKFLDFRTLKIQNTSFVNQRLESHYSDIIYTCRWKNKNQVAYLTFLLEHKSYPEKYPHLQLMRYMLEGYEYQLKQKEQLSLIIPVILYHGREQWKARPFKEYFDLPHPVYGMFVPSFDYILVNLADYADEQILAIGMSFLASSMLLFKHKQDKDFVLKNYRQIFIFVEGYESRTETMRFLNTLILYVFQSFDIERKEILDIIEDLPKNVSDMFISTYDKAVESGKVKGEEIGIRKGEEIGIRKGEEIGIRKGEEIGIRKGEEIGIRKGEEIGTEKAIRTQAIRTAVKVLKEVPGLDNGTIAKISSLPEKFVARLRIALEKREEKNIWVLISAALKGTPMLTEKDKMDLLRDIL